MPEIYVDADACPVKPEILKVAERHDLPVTFVANSGLRPSRDPMVKNVIVSGAFDAADFATGLRTEGPAESEVIDAAIGVTTQTEEGRDAFALIILTLACEIREARFFLLVGEGQRGAPGFVELTLQHERLAAGAQRPIRGELPAEGRDDQDHRRTDRAGLGEEKVTQRESLRATPVGAIEGLHGEGIAERDAFRGIAVDLQDRVTGTTGFSGGVAAQVERRATNQIKANRSGGPIMSGLRVAEAPVVLPGARLQQREITRHFETRRAILGFTATGSRSGSEC